MTRLWVWAFVLFSSAVSYAGEGLDVKDWLGRPGVKLLAVEFYASWCGPCKAAVPRWKELHERYRDQGLRLIVVSVQDPDGACVNPGWNPDDVVCDTEGRLARAYHVGDRLPAAFLWSWRGDLLVRKGHVDEVERAVAEELARLPRITLDEGMGPLLRDLLRSELARSGKVDVVAGEEEERLLNDVRKRSQDVQYANGSSCRLGERLAPNSLLKASFVASGSGKRLLIQLFSAETGCLNASAGVFWNETRPELSAAEAVAELLNQLRVQVELPGETAATHAINERDIGEESSTWEFNGAKGAHIVSFETDPPGAVAMLDGKVLCQATPCSKLVATGSHLVEFQLENYLPVKERVAIQEDTASVSRKLAADFGWISVYSTPSGLKVLLDGRPWGVTPLQRREVSAGPHQILVSDARYFDKGKEVVVEQGEEKTVEVTLEPREGALEIHAKDGRDNDIQAEVWIDGSRAGSTPFSEKLLVGPHEVEVVGNGTKAPLQVNIEEQQVVRRTVVLSPAGSPRRETTGPSTVPLQSPGSYPRDYADRPLIKEKGHVEAGASLEFPKTRLTTSDVVGDEMQLPWTDMGASVYSRTFVTYGLLKGWDATLDASWVLKSPSSLDALGSVRLKSRWALSDSLAVGVGTQVSPMDLSADSTLLWLGADYLLRLSPKMTFLMESGLSVATGFASESWQISLSGTVRWSLSRFLFSDMSLAYVGNPGGKLRVSAVPLSVSGGLTVGGRLDMGMGLSYRLTKITFDDTSIPGYSTEDISLLLFGRLLF